MINSYQTIANSAPAFERLCARNREAATGSPRGRNKWRRMVLPYGFRYKSNAAPLHFQQQEIEMEDDYVFEFRLKTWQVIGLLAIVFFIGLSIGVANAAEPQDLPATPIEPNVATNSVHITSNIRITDPVKLEAAAVKVLVSKSGLTSAAAKRLLRPLGELDLQLCLERVLLARFDVASDGFANLGSRVFRVPQYAEPQVPALPQEPAAQ